MAISSRSCGKVPRYPSVFNQSYLLSQVTAFKRNRQATYLVPHSRTLDRGVVFLMKGREGALLMDQMVPPFAILVLCGILVAVAFSVASVWFLISAEHNLGTFVFQVQSVEHKSPAQNGLIIQSFLHTM